MHLKRIKVNNFRALKNIEIDFESEFPRRIFPLGSLNGGGKSTLLQLTFILLHCSASQDPDQLNFIKNLLSDFRVKTHDDLEDLAVFTIVHKEKEYCIRFYACQDTYIKQLLQSEGNKLSSDILLSFPKTVDLQNHEKKLQSIGSKIELIVKLIRQIENLSSIEDLNERKERFDGIRRNLNDYRRRGILNISGTLSENIIEELQEQLDINKSNLLTSQTKYEELKYDFHIVTRCLEKKNLNYVTTYHASQEDVNESLFYQVDNVMNKQDAPDLLKSISSKIFLAAPSTHVYLFLSKEDRLSIFKTQKSRGIGYFQALDLSKAKLDIFFSTYDFFETRFLINLFTQARDRDFQYAIEHKGEYGTNYPNLLTEINSILPGKSINVTSDLSEITFSMTIDSEECSLLPEDLSHGELKKLNIYTWIKSYNIKDAIVLMDEPEIALHPDWQHDLTNNLWEWEPTNQYILATHSYEICQALTSHHIKEIEPKLFKPESLQK